MEDRKMKEMERMQKIKDNNECLVCEIVVAKEFKEKPMSILQGDGGTIEMAQMVKTLIDTAEALSREFPEVKKIIPMLNQSSGMKTAYKEVTSWEG